MEGWPVLGIVFGFIFLLLAFGVPIGFCILGGAIIGLFLVGGVNTAVGFFTHSIHHLSASYVLAVAPLFILVGTLAEAGGLGERAYLAFHKLLGHFRGGLLMATTGAAALFGACCGSSIASAALFSRLALPELREFGYQERISLGCIATAGGLAVLIPPSIMMVFYGILTGTSVGRVLLAGIVPGIVLSILIMLAIFIRIKLNPEIAPLLTTTVTRREKLTSIVGIWPVLVVFFVIIGGIYTGICTPTEAGALSAAVVFLYGVVRRIGRAKLIWAFHEATALTAQIFILIIAGQMLAKVVSLSGVTHSVLVWMATAGLPLATIWVIFILIYLILGAILDPISMLVLTLPLSFPILTALGVDPIALGVIVVILVEVAVITPPIGFNVYVVAAMAGVDPVEVFRGSVMFFFVLMLMVVIIIALPGLATWLPSTVYW